MPIVNGKGKPQGDPLVLNFFSMLHTVLHTDWSIILCVHCWSSTGTLYPVLLPVVCHRSYYSTAYGIVHGLHAAVQLTLILMVYL